MGWRRSVREPPASHSATTIKLWYMHVHTHKPPADADAQSPILWVLVSNRVFSGGNVKLNVLIENVK